MKIKPAADRGKSKQEQPAMTKITISGAELKAFINDPAVWTHPESHYDEIVLVVDPDDPRNPAGPDFDPLMVPDAAHVTVFGGVLWDFLQEQRLDLVLKIFEWKKTQATESVIVTIPKGTREQLVQFLSKTPFVVHGTEQPQAEAKD